VAEGEFKAIQIITSKKGSIRSNHYHKRGGHLLYVLSGRMRYVEQDDVDGGELSERIVEAGESVFTGPMKPHVTEFLEDSVLVCAATANRADGAYADDLVRVKIL
jgi:quercetin dioxygenase-like cupin family protein